MNWQTAQALRRRGLIEIGPYEADLGTIITLADASGRQAGDET